MSTPSSSPLIREVRLELMRHGPTHNQLLSPLTQYLAICGNHSAMSVQVPFEHADHLRRVRALRYDTRDPESVRDAFLAMGRDVTHLLGSVSTLPAEISSAGAFGEIIHLRLVLSAAELAALPFEMASRAVGLPDAGHYLFQGERPVVVTREVRRVASGQVRWPTGAPKVLFAAASPPEFREVPWKAHFLALRYAINPWIGWQSADDADDNAGRVSEVKRHLKVLPRATLDEIQAECTKSEYTHVHILAHGASETTAAGDESRFRLAFHSKRDAKQTDRVDGVRLAAALCSRGAAGHRPTVVTIAGCDSGDQGSVLTPGGSVAHALHEAGVPLVVASQFPLSFLGSVFMTEVLYNALLRGVDPRVAVHMLRQVLLARVPDRHDWAAIVAYASLPDDLDGQMEEAWYHRTRKSADVSLARLQSALAAQARARGAEVAFESAHREPPDAPSEADVMKHQHELQTLVSEFESRLTQVSVARRSQIHGFLGSVAVRYAWLRWRSGRDQNLPRPVGEGSGPSASLAEDASEEEALRSARTHYHRAFQLDPSKAWAFSQKVILDFALGGCEKLDVDAWCVIGTLCHDALASGIDDRVTSAHGTLVEWHVLSVARDPSLSHDAAAERAIEHFQALVDRVGNRAFEAFSALRQVIRFKNWWAREEPGESEVRRAVRAVAERVIEAAFRWRVPDRWYEHEFRT